MELEFDRDTALMIERTAYSEGVSPAGFIRAAVRHTMGAAESGDGSYIEMLREG